MIEYVQGDLIQLAKEGEFDVIVHGCNCFNTMGAGVAKQIKDNFPEAYFADSQTIKGDLNKLGTVTFAKIENLPKPLTVINAYTQYHYGKDGSYFRLKAFKSCLIQIKYAFPDINTRFGFPMIGTGLGGARWENVEKLIRIELEYYRVTVVLYNENNVPRFR